MSLIFECRVLFFFFGEDAEDAEDPIFVEGKFCSIQGGSDPSY